MLDLKNHAVVSGAIFLAVFVFHGLRIYMGWDAVIGGWAVPMWLSWVALVVTGYLAYTGFAASGHIGKR